MRNGKWMKGFGIGIIILFLGASVLPSINAKVVNVTTTDNNINNPASESKALFIGLLKSLNDDVAGLYLFDCIIIYFAEYLDGQLINRQLQINTQVVGSYDTKTGIVSEHFVCCVLTEQFP